MKTKDAIDLAGNAAALAAMLDISQSAISQWGELVPDKRVWQLKVLSPKWFDKKDKWDGITERRTGPADRRTAKGGI